MTQVFFSYTYTIHDARWVSGGTCSLCCLPATREQFVADPPGSKLLKVTPLPNPPNPNNEEAPFNVNPNYKLPLIITLITPVRAVAAGGRDRAAPSTFITSNAL